MATVFRINWRFHDDENEMVCTQHCGQPTGASELLVTDISAVISAELTTLFRAMLTVAYTLDEFEVVRVADPNTLLPVPTSSLVPVVALGTRTATDIDLPPRIGGTVDWLTPFKGRSFRGRMYAPPAENPDLLVADEFIAAGSYLTAITAFAQRVLDGNRTAGGGADFGGVWDAQDCSFGVYSPTRAALDSGFFGVTPITAFRVNTRPAYLSSRDR